MAERMNIFEALTIANGEDIGEVSGLLDGPDQLDNGLQSGDDHTSDKEPDIATLRSIAGTNRSMQAQTLNEAASGPNFVFPSDSEDSDADDFPLLRARMEAASQVESRSGETAEPAPGTHASQDQTFVAKDGTRWSSEPPVSMGHISAENVFRAPRNQTPGCDHVKEAVDAFMLFFSKILFDLLVKYTNLEGIRKKGENFVKTDETEMKGFVGCLLFLGAMKQNMLPTTVVFDAFYGQKLVRANFSRNRFLQLLSFIRFDDKATRNARRRDDVFAPFRDFWVEFTQNLKKHYIPGPFITVDEQLVPFRGRCSFLQYLPSKPDRYGLKIFWAAEAGTNYPLVAEPYLGKPLGAQRQENLGRNVAIKLSSPFYNTGRNITADNFFTDMVLSNTLRDNGLTFVGTVRSNRTFLPEPFKQKIGQDLHGSSFVFKDKTTLVNYQSKSNKNVVVLSTMHHDRAVDPLARKKKPDMIRFYNVDAMDKMAHAYSTKRVTKRWPVVMFYNSIDLATIAARVIWQKKFPKDRLSHPDMRQQFIIRVAEQLCLERIQTRLIAKNLSRPLRSTLTSVAEHLGNKEVVETPAAGVKRRRPTASGSGDRSAPQTARPTDGDKKSKGCCGFCHWKSDRKSRMSCFNCRNWMCKEHASNTCPECAELVSSSTVITIHEESGTH